MWNFIQRLFSLIVTQKPASPKAVAARPTAYTTRLGKTVPVDDAFHAWTSGDLNEMLKALPVKTNLIDRHFLLMGIVDATYKNRTDPKMAQRCAQVAEMHLTEFPKIAPALKKDMDGILPRVTTFQHYATLLSEQGEYDKAIAVCEQAIKYGLRDNTQSGFKGRIERIKEQKAKHQST